MLCARRGYVCACCPHVCVRVRLFVWLSTRFALLRYAMSLFVFCLVSCTVLYAHNLQPSPPTTTAIAEAMQERPYTLWPSLRTHISRILRSAQPRAPWVIRPLESATGAFLTLKASLAKTKQSHTTKPSQSHGLSSSR